MSDASETPDRSVTDPTTSADSGPASPEPQRPLLPAVRQRLIAPARAAWLVLGALGISATMLGFSLGYVAGHSAGATSRDRVRTVVIPAPRPPVPRAFLVPHELHDSPCCGRGHGVGHAFLVR